MVLIKNVLVATDFSEPSAAALLYGRHFARAYGATLHVLHVVDDAASRVMPMAGALPDVGRMQEDLQQAADQELAVLVTDDDRRSLSAQTTTVTSADPAQAIVNYARKAEIDLLVIGTHGRGGLARLFMGSVAQHVVRTAPCPVLTVRHPEREIVVPDALATIAATSGVDATAQPARPGTGA